MRVAAFASSSSGQGLLLPSRIRSSFRSLAPPLSMSRRMVTDGGRGQSVGRRQALSRLLLSVFVTLGLGNLASQASAAPGPEVDTCANPGGCSAVPKIKLGSLEVSTIMQGHWQIAGGHGEVDRKQRVKDMIAHYDAGITTLDTADIYGFSQEYIGDFLKERPQAVVCTKLCFFNNLENIRKPDVRKKIEKSLKDLGVKQLDLVAFFWSDFSIPKYIQVGRWLNEFRLEGLIKEIGVTNFDTEHLEKLVDVHEVPVVSNQVQYSILDRRAQHGMSAYCEKRGIKLITYGTIGGGLLSQRFLGRGRPTRSELNTTSLQMYLATIGRFGGWELYQELMQAMSDAAKKHNSTVANVAARYVLDQQSVGAVIVGVRNSDHIAENINALSLKLDEEDYAKFNAVLARAKGLEGDIYSYERS